MSLIIAVVYHKVSQVVLGWCRFTTDTSIGAEGIISPELIMRGVNWNQVDYGLYRYKQLSGKTDDEGNPIPWTLPELDLQAVTADDLPHSMHIAALKAVDIPNKKATVVRKWMGQNYEVPNCRVALGALEAYQAAKLKVFNPAYAITAPQNADCFVLVYFVSENPYDTAIEIPVIVDKIVK